MVKLSLVLCANTNFLILSSNAGRRSNSRSIWGFKTPTRSGDSCMPNLDTTPLSNSTFVESSTAKLVNNTMYPILSKTEITLTFLRISKLTRVAAKLAPDLLGLVQYINPVLFWWPASPGALAFLLLFKFAFLLVVVFLFMLMIVCGKLRQAIEQVITTIATYLICFSIPFIYFFHQSSKLYRLRVEIRVNNKGGLPMRLNVTI